MPRLTVGTTPVQLAWANPKRKFWSVEFIPASVIAGNTGLIYLKRGSAPSADINSNSWDTVLKAGDQEADNKDGAQPECPYKGAVYAVSDTADQIINLQEVNVEEKQT
ncbi:MAG: hypothetical protein PHP03_02190 [Candidatus Pacebacteria bacterium]|nr:hypothetical protein [Candidatus Paceibacterota bacterium]